MSDESTAVTEDAGSIDLRDPGVLFPILEELGGALMQNEWMQRNWPEHDAVKNLQEEAEKMFDDTVDMLLGRACATKVLDNGWAGSSVAAHLRKVISAGDGMSDEDVLRGALRSYASDFALVAEHDEFERAEGGQAPVQEYIEFMVAWSEVFSGEADSLELPRSFRLYKSERETGK